MKEDTEKKIQKYLDQEMTPEERKAFETDLSTDQELAQEVALFKDMEELLADSPENALRKNLQILNDQVKEGGDASSGLLKHLLWVIPVILIATWWSLSPEKTNTTQKIETEIPLEKEVAPTIETPPPTIEQEEAATPAEKTTTTPEVQAPQKTPTQKKTEKKEREPIQATRPIAANFEPNPSLEFLIQNNVRDNAVVLEVQKQQKNVSLPSPDETIAFEFVATLTSSSNLSEQDFKLHLFSNDPSAFEDFQPLSTDDLNLTQSADNSYEIDFQKSIKLAPGLYYYILEDFAEEKIYYVGKFEIVGSGQ